MIESSDQNVCHEQLQQKKHQHHHLDVFVVKNLLYQYYMPVFESHSEAVEQVTVTSNT